MFSCAMTRIEMKRSAIFLLLFTVCGLASVFKSSGILAEQIRQIEWSVGGDKHLHFMVSFTLAMASAWVTPTRLRWLAGLCGWPSLILLAAVVIDECSQYYLPRRQFSFADMAVNISGVTSGVLFYTLIRKLFIR